MDSNNMNNGDNNVFVTQPGENSQPVNGTQPGGQSADIQPQQDTYYQPINTVQPVPAEQKGQSIASMVLGICGLIAWCIPLFGYPVGIVGLVMGIKGMKKGGKNMAIAGIVLCIITLVATLINSILGAINAVNSMM